MKTTDVLLLIAAAALFLLVAFLALAETALTQMSLARALALKQEHHRGAGALVHLVERRERWLTPLLFAMLLMNFIGATIVGIVTHGYLGPLGVILVTVGEVMVVFVLAEACPKTWAVQHSDRAALVSAPFVSAFVDTAPIRVLARCLIRVSNAILPGTGLSQGPFVTKAELLAMTDVAGADQVIKDDERKLIRSVIEFGETTAGEVRVPRTDMIVVQAAAEAAEVLDLTINAGYSRLPVYGEGIDDIVGVVHQKDLVRAVRDGQGGQPVHQLARSALFVPETKRVEELMREMQDQKCHVAIVVDEYGGTSGLVTMEDVVEEVVGELIDELDVEQPPVQRLPGGAARVSTRMSIDDVNEVLDTNLPEGDWNSVGGLMLSLLGHIPAERESVVYGDLRLIAEGVHGHRVDRIHISPVETHEQGEHP
jgi:CBS domain containing-hemolysin-like protein